MTTVVAPSRLIEARHRSLADRMDEWTAWLSERVDRNWRPSEWQHELMLFRGDPANPLTAVRKCTVTACPTITVGRTFCSDCSRDFERLGKPDLAAFQASHQPDRNRIYGFAAICWAANGHCGRDSSTHGLCAAHYSRWKTISGRNPELEIAFWAKSQKPYAALEPCGVGGCLYQRTMINELCPDHRRQWRNHFKATGTVDGKTVRKAWARTIAPYLQAPDFSLAPLSDLARLELLYVLQRGSLRGKKLEPAPIRFAVRHLADLPSIALAGESFRLPKAGETNHSGNRGALLREIQNQLRFALEEFQGIKPTDHLVWDLTAVGVVRRDSNPKKNRRNPGTMDFGKIEVVWLRDLLMQWATDTHPVSRDIWFHYRVCVLASQTLALRPGGGRDPSMLKFTDMAAVIKSIEAMTKADGTALKSKSKAIYATKFFDFLEWGRNHDLLDDLSQKFGRHRDHNISYRDEENEEQIGKSIPESVIRQLDAHVDQLGDGMPYGPMATEDVKAMAKTFYFLLRDTGRRPYEIGSLFLDCLEKDGEDWQLIWDNHKAGRYRRRLPITQTTVDIVLTWKKRRLGMNVPEGSGEYLFPARTAESEYDHPISVDIWQFIRTWADAIPVLDSELPGPDGAPAPFERKRVFPYAFRHSYCQRHADADVPQDVLQSLMDHVSPTTTSGYYKVSLKRKREAIKAVRAHVTDRLGNPTPMTSNLAYEQRSVAVAWGNCIEPNNVKAGGAACPIRHQCAGCPSYRPDPSYLPAIEDHIRALKADREAARDAGVAQFVVNNFNDQIEAYQGVRENQKRRLEAMTPQERQEVEEAAAVLRKVRAGSKARTVTLGLPALGPPKETAE
ncbi:tyrosine-type recombinase/integrase [Streptomyces anulatus]|uniref:tyrosine-type recombinase/integrase n=1 Tax=Streptomyces anulatus TaxID=1892 RepID=UPI0038702739